MSDNISQDYSQQLEEHSVEGIEVLQGTSSFMAHALLYLIIALIGAGLTWSFITKADVIITAKGRLAERKGAKKVYSPVAGELVEIFVSEGVPVGKGDLIARIKSSQAIQSAGAATQARLALENMTRLKEQFPAQQELIQREIKSIEEKLKLLTREYNHQKEAGLRQLTDSQKRELEMMRLQLSDKERAVAQAKELFGKYKKLAASPGGGGISGKQLQEKETEFKRGEAEYKQTLSRLEDLELNFSRQYLSSSQKIEQLNMQIIQGRLALEKKQNLSDQATREIEMKYLAAKEAYQAASKVNFSDLDENNFLVIRAPADGEISSLSYHQPGEKINPSTPIVTISEKGSGKAVLLAIQDKDRGLLKVGQDVKIKFHAFPYQRFGFLTGKLEYISNNAQAARDGRSMYKGKVSLDKDHYLANDRQLPVRFGMQADVEIVVQRRRVIDFALDPFRKLASK
ncbi:MAG: HlyD family efflux transporter periplasmic adaptor subunit [Thermodesulfobacteriota bacterium]